MISDRPNEDSLDTNVSFAQRSSATSGRPNSESLVHKSYQDSQTSEEGQTITGSNQSLLVERRVFSHISVGSPRDQNGKLKLISNPYQGHKIEESIGVIAITGSAAGYGSFRSYQWIGAKGGGYSPKNLSSLEKAAVARARTKFREEVQNASANLLLAVAERREIFETVMALSWNVFKKMRDYKKLVSQLNQLSEERRKKRIKSIVSGISVKGMSKAKDTFGDLWLFFIYGVMPLLLDMQTLVSHIKKIDPRQVHGRGRKSFSESRKLVDVYWTVTEQIQGYVSCHVTGFVTIADPLEKLLAEYGFTNLATIVWERIPYSFLVDWIIGIGSWINSLSALDGVEVSGYNETVTFRSGMNLSNLKSTNSGGWKISSTLANPHFWMYKTKTRNVLKTPPLPPLTFGSNVSWRKILTSFSLLNQQLRKL